MTPQKAAPAPPADTGRKPWIKKTPIEVVLEQIGKQEAHVADLREALEHEEHQLVKLQNARKALEAQ